MRKYAFPLLALAFLGIAWVLTQFAGDDDEESPDPTPTATVEVTGTPPGS